ncbi:MAG: hypothetical protein AB1458_05370, partial [Bacteroidota bacterium]
VGRKIRVPEKEAEGVQTYTALLGTVRAVLLWIFILAVTFVLAVLASIYAGHGQIAFIVLGGIFLACALPALLFLNRASEKRSKTIELASALWTIAMYLTLGGGPMLSKLLFN